MEFTNEELDLTKRSATENLQAYELPSNDAAIAIFGDDEQIEFDLCDVEDINRRHPETFQIPDKFIRNHIVVDMLIKINVKWRDPWALGERFWVRITEARELCTGERVLYGTAENKTTFVPYGSLIGPIRPRNICDVDLEDFLRQHQEKSNLISAIIS